LSQSIAPSRVEAGSRPANAMAGIGLKVISVCFMLSMSSLVKASEGIPPGQLVFFRSVFAIIPIVVFLAYQGEFFAGLKTTRPFAHLWRGLVGVGGMALGFLALTRLPLPEAIAIQYATPLLIVVMSAVFLREQVRMYRWSAVIVGLGGVGIIISPQLSFFTGGGNLGEAGLGVIAALVSCLFASTAMLLVRNLVTTERSATIVLYFSLTCTLGGLCSAPFGWVMPTPTQAVMLVAAGIAGGIGQVLMTEAYRYAEPSVVAPFEYTSLLLSIGVGYVFFGDAPTVTMLIGAAILVGAGIFIILREHALGLERSKARQIVPPQG
jgi:drug/metabolite transporter (DMT)-like permease